MPGNRERIIATLTENANLSVFYASAGDGHPR